MYMNNITSLVVLLLFAAGVLLIQSVVVAKVYFNNQIEVQQLLNDIKQTRLKRGYAPY